MTDFTGIKDLWDKKKWNGHVSAYNPWVFAIGSLSFDPEKIVRKKVYNESDFRPSWPMRTGTSIHEYIQSRLGPDWRCEEEVWLDLPYQWKNVKNDRITIYGSIDGLNLETHEVLEIKTSYRNDAGPAQYHLLQISAYAAIAAERYGGKFTPHLLRIALKDDDVVNDYILTDEQVAAHWNTVKQRAIATAERIDMLLGEVSAANAKKRECQR